MTVFVKYKVVHVAPHPLLDDTTEYKTKILNVDSVEEINDLFKNIININILKE